MRSAPRAKQKDAAPHAPERNGFRALRPRGMSVCVGEETTAMHVTCEGRVASDAVADASTWPVSLGSEDLHGDITP
eukprot:1181098-Rhodomonas_salina.3